MTAPHTTDPERAKLCQAVGECVLAWSNVELALSLLFDLIVNSDDPLIPHAALAAVRSFDARLKMIGDVFNTRFEDPDCQERTDWKLLYNRCSSLNQLRNQVAHATEVRGEKKEPVLEPFFVLTAKKPHVSIAQVQERTDQFYELFLTIMWFDDVLRKPPEKHTEFHKQVPDLLLRLRDEAAQRRAKQKCPPQPSEG